MKEKKPVREVVEARLRHLLKTYGKDAVACLTRADLAATGIRGEGAAIRTDLDGWTLTVYPIGAMVALKQLRPVP